MSARRLEYYPTEGFGKGTPMKDIYYTIVGTDTDTNVGLARFMGVILVFILVVGTLFWAIGG